MMTYIKRHLSVSESDGKGAKKNVRRDVPEDEVLGDSRSLIILGEPGSGKSEMVKHFSEQAGVRYFTAAQITAMSPSPEETNGRVVIIDGLDEIATYSNQPPIAQIVSKLQHSGASRYIFTCRAADWQDATASSILEILLKGDPIVATLLPMSDEAVQSFILAYSQKNGLDADNFSSKASRHGSTELLRNPQMLSMFLDASTTAEWPQTRLALYSRACQFLIGEDNRIHSEVRPAKYSNENLLDAAGFICAQLILSNISSVVAKGKTAAGVVSALDLSDDHFPLDRITAVLGTKVFTAASSTTLAPAHRTIAEFLAAKWLSKALEGGLSIRRFETLLYSSGYVVSSALRGLHAWIATLYGGSLTRKLARRDPYGLLVYGDASNLTDSNARHLICHLEALSRADPEFRDDRSHEGRPLLRPALKKDIIQLIRHEKTGHKLAQMILESIKGEPFALLIVQELEEIVLRPGLEYGLRFIALEALQESGIPIDWNAFHKTLLTSGDVDCLLLACDIMACNASIFTGAAMIQTFFRLSKQTGEHFRFKSAKIAPKLTDEQVLDALHAIFLMSIPTDGKDNVLRNFISYVLIEVFKRMLVVAPDLLWHVVRYASFSGINRQEYNSACSVFLNADVQYRREVQTCALMQEEDTYTLDGLTLLAIIMGQECSPTEEDAIFHLNRIIEFRESIYDWPQKWCMVVSHISNEGTRNGLALMHAIAQSSGYPELKPYLPGPSEQEKRALREQHKSYEAIREILIAGHDLEATNAIAEAYLKDFLFYESGHKNSIDPERNVQALVGEKMVGDALNSIEAIIRKVDIPSPREITDARVHEEQLLIEPVLIVYCHRERNTEQIPMKIVAATLAAWPWDDTDTYQEEPSMEQLRISLERRLFADPIAKHNFLVDTVEPYLQGYCVGVPNLLRIVGNGPLADIAGPLSVSWLKRYAFAMSRYTLMTLFKVVAQSRQEEALLDMAREMVFRNSWHSHAQEGIWKGVLFVFDFENSVGLLSQYAAGSGLRTFGHLQRVIDIFKNVTLSTRQLFFLLKNYAPQSVEDEFDNDGVISDDEDEHVLRHFVNEASYSEPWLLKHGLIAHSRRLSGTFTPEVSNFLKELAIEQKGDDELKENLKSLYYRHKRLLSETRSTIKTLPDVRSILLRQIPSTHKDLQAYLLDELDALQTRLREGQTNDYTTFWQGDTPHDENYCRDRIVSQLTARLDRITIRAYIEGAMPRSRRCDILCSAGSIDLAIEVKGQWHADLWTAAATQLKSYSAAYRSEGTGIYLVLWFGPNEKKRPVKSPSGEIPTSAKELKRMLKKTYAGKMSKQIRIKVLDVSKNGIVTKAP
jgi:hypothetical protein